MIHLIAEVHQVPVTAPKRDTLRHLGVFLRDACHNLNRYMDAAQKVHVVEGAPERPYRRPSGQWPI